MGFIVAGAKTPVNVRLGSCPQTVGCGALRNAVAGFLKVADFLGSVSPEIPFTNLFPVVELGTTFGTVQETMFMPDPMHANPKMFDVVVKQLTSQLTHGDFVLGQLPKTLRAVLGENQWREPMWRSRIDKDTGEIYTFECFEDFVAAPPTAGIGTSMKMLKDVCRDDPVVLDMMDQAVQRPHGGARTKMLNQQLAPETDSKQDASSRHLRRLRKDRPDLHERVLAGEMTASEAAIEAGFYPRRVSISLDSAASAIATIERNASPEFIAEMKKLWGVQESGRVSTPAEEKIRQQAQVGNRDFKDPRSPEWAYQAVEYLKLKWRHLSIDRERFLSMVDTVVLNRAWEVIPTDRPYGDVDTLFREELGVSYQEAIEAIARPEAVVQERG